MSKALNRLLRRGRRLLDIDVEEISVVDKAANGRVFAIVKRAVANPDVSELLAAFADEDLEELMKQGDEKALKAALKSALAKLKPYMDGLPDDIAAAIKTLAGFAAGPPATADGSYGYPQKKKGKERPEGERFDSDTDRATFHKADRKPFPANGTLSDLMGAIVGYAKPSLAAKWASEKIQKAVDDGDLELEDVVIDEETGEPHSHGVSKSLKGQGADDDPDAAEDETEDLWPSL